MLLEEMALRTVPGGWLGDGVPQNKPYSRQGSSEPRPAPCPPRSPVVPGACPQRMGCDGPAPRSQPQGSPTATPQGCPTRDPFRHATLCGVTAGLLPPGLSTGKKAGRDQPPFLPRSPQPSARG